MSVYGFLAVSFFQNTEKLRYSISDLRNVIRFTKPSLSRSTQESGPADEKEEKRVKVIAI
jgi:hypothetical protein